MLHLHGFSLYANLTLDAAAILDMCSTVANVQQDLSGTKKNETSHEFARVNVKISPTNTQSASSSSGPEEKQQQDSNQNTRFYFYLTRSTKCNRMANATSTTFFSKSCVRLQVSEISVCTSNARNSIMDAMPSTIAILSTIVKGLDAMPSTIITQDKGLYIECKCLCMHSGQRLCTANLGSKSLDGFFYVFHSLSSKEPFPCPAAWKVVRL